MAKFLHAADLHLGSPLKSLGDAIGEDEHQRLVKLVNGAFDRLVSVAIEEQVDFVVLAGDVYDTADRDPGSQRRFLNGLRRLTENDIKVFMVHGNHDPLTRDIKNGLIPAGVVVFPPGKLGVETVTMKNGAEVVVAGVSYKKKEESENLVPLFEGVQGRTIVGVLHTNVGGNVQHGNYAPCSVSDLEQSPVHYWALGHIHMRSINRTSRGWWAYPGNLQGRSVKAAECGPKGVLIVEVDEDGYMSEPRFVDCSAVRFERVDVSVDNVDEVGGVDDAIRDRLQELMNEIGDVPLLVRLRLVGQTDIPALLDGKWDIAQTIEEANEVLGAGAIVKVELSCVPKIDLNRERERQTLLGEVFTDLDRQDISEEVREVASSYLVKVLGVRQ